MQVRFGVLGPVTAWGDDVPLALKGPRHRAVLARLITARRRVVTVDRLAEDLWDDPPPGAVGTLQTFVADLRRALEPERAPRTAARLLVTEGPGYALRALPDQVDAWQFEATLAAAAQLTPQEALDRLTRALELWRGPAYADFPDYSRAGIQAGSRAGTQATSRALAWVRTERLRLAELRLQAVEQRARALLALDRPAEAAPGLDAHLADHPGREDAWRLLALALYRTGRQGEALAVLRRARTTLADRLGLDPAPALRRLEADILAQAPHLDAAQDPAATAARLWTQATAAYDRAVSATARSRLESTVTLLRDLAVSGGPGLEAAQQQRAAAVAAAEELADPELTARIIGAYDVPAVWPRSDDPVQAARIVAAAERTLAALPNQGHPAARCRLLATIALETRGSRSPRGPWAAHQAERLARELDDPALLAVALNGRFMQSFTRAGQAGERDAIGRELVHLAARHGLANYEVLGHLILLQARSAFGDFAAADAHATATERLAERHERPLAAVFTTWYRALRLAATGASPQHAEAAYHDAAVLLDGAGMPGLTQGLLPLAQLCLRLSHHLPPEVDLHQDWGPYLPWAQALSRPRPEEAVHPAESPLPEPPPGLLYEALCCLEAATALHRRDRPALTRLHARLLPAAGQLAGAGSGLLSAGPVDEWLTAITTALQTP